MLSLLRLVSPALPIGAYSFSRGMEQAVELGWVRDASSAQAWIAGTVGRAATRLDAPAVWHLHAAFSRGDQATVERWASVLHALRETAELLAEDRHLGEALAKLLGDMGHERAIAWRRHPHRAYPVLFALAAVEWSIAPDDAVLGYLWALCEGQVGAAVRLIPLGQTDGQRILSRLSLRIPRWADEAKRHDLDTVGGFLPGLSLVSALHEEQHFRIFRS
jgi:urease accessory protein